MKQFKKSLFVLLLVAVFVFTNTVVAFGANGGSTKKVSASDWMAEVPDNTYINCMNIPGTHDSGMAHAQWGTGEFAETQSMLIDGQLKAGARIFDIRLRYNSNNENVLCHGAGMLCCDAYKSDAGPFASVYTYEDALNDMADFLIAHPTETIIATVQHEFDADDDDPDYENGVKHDIHTACEKAEENLLTRLSEINGGIYWVNQRHSPKVKLGDVRGCVILFPFGCGFGDLMPDELNGYKFSFTDKWNVIKPFLDNAPDQELTVCRSDSDFRAAYTSCTGQKTHDENDNEVDNNITGYIPTAGQEAEQMNRLLRQYPFEYGAYYGWISMDYITEDLARRLFECNDTQGIGRQKREVKPTYIKEIRAFCDDEYDDAVEECYDQGYTLLKGNSFTNVNPKGDPIVIGYKLTENPDGAITDIVGRYDSDTPKGYEKVLVDGSLYNYFTRWAGGDSEDTYLFLSRSKNHAPITMLELLDSASGEDMVKYDGKDEIFNLQAGFDFFRGINMIREKGSANTGTMVSTGNMILIMIGFAVLLGTVIVLLIRQKALKKEAASGHQA